ncbi:FAD-binding oxidoreductase [Streptosporangiaceae bacterium NEAU-GS5]|nr:FAD-binding oxidoreductase [Streptosporangiaceae bacterium NEAU-GS5]
MDVLVVGAGVVGLTTAIQLAEAGATVRVVAERPPGKTTSAVASALVGPTFAPAGHPLRRWEDASVAAFAREPEGSGVRLAPGLLAAREPDPTTPPSGISEVPADAGLDDIPGMRMAEAGELPEGFSFGFHARLPLVDMGRYLGHLERRLGELGVEIQSGRVESLAGLGVSLVANCSGLGARDLAGDVTVEPVRGHHVVVENPGIDAFFIEAPYGRSWAGIFPHGPHVILGGTADVGDWSTEPREQDAAEILRLCRAVEPRLNDARVLAHQVGLRPRRPAVRLEVEEVAGVRIVHNYGHGGLGVTLAWGCAADAAALLLA